MEEEIEDLTEVRKRAIRQREKQRKAVFISMTILTIVALLCILYWAEFRVF